MPESERLTARCAAMPGLADIRFDLALRPGATHEKVCREVNAMLDAVEAGRCAPLIFNDSQRNR